jgi:O-antigen biosynthesis protein
VLERKIGDSGFDGVVSDNLITVASFIPKFIHSPSAWLGHMPFAGWIVREFSPKRFVELGAHFGHSYFSFCQAVLDAGVSTECIAVDTWKGDEHTGPYGEDVFVEFAAHNAEHYEGFSRLLRMPFDDASVCFLDGTIDLLHLDGAHTYEAVRHDFEVWLPKLAPGAVVLLHDINIRHLDFGVWKLWEELQRQYPNNLDFLHSCGLGVLQLNNAPDCKKLEWLQPNFPSKNRLINYFAALGLRQMERYDFNELKRQTANLHQELAVRNDEIFSLRQKISTIEISDSWRVTRPLRWLGSQMRNVQHILSKLVAILTLSGGLRRATARAMCILSCEGLSGIKRCFFSFRAALCSDVFDRNDYAEWVRRYDTVTGEKREKILGLVKIMTDKPLISVVMPVYNAKPEWLARAIESVRQQIYPYWELCIADDASLDIAIRPILMRYAKEDPRIKLVFRKKNGHISAASNSAIGLASGAWVAFLDQDDLLEEHALFWVADAINRHPHARLIYSDEDKIDENGQRFDPYFKSDWNLDLFYSHNLITHLGIYEGNLLRDLDGLRLGYEGAQDYDLALRFIERIKADQIYHIPRILYHWRAHAKSTSRAVNVKPYALHAGKKALDDHFRRLGVNASAELLDFGMYRIRYVLPESQPLVTLIIPSRNKVGILKKCIESILKKTTYRNYEVLIVDNDSDDPATIQYFNEMQSDPRVRVVHDNRPFNYSALNNAAVGIARGEIVGLLNNDLEVISSEWLSEMVSHALRPDVGVVGARLWYPDETLQHGGVILGVGGVAGHSHKLLPRHQYGYFARASLIQTFSAVTAACLVTRKSVYAQVGGFNEIDLRVAFNDVDFCLRVREAGFRNIWTPYAELFHHESATRGLEDTPEKQERFSKEVQFMQQRWGSKLLNDPAYSPNLTLKYQDFSLAWPPRVNDNC